MQNTFYITNLLIKKRTLLFRSVFFELKTQYAGSILGMLWIFIAPLFLMATYIVVYVFILKVKPDQCSLESYILYLMSGLLPYLGFIQSIQKASSSILGNKAAIYNTLYPIEFVPIRAVISGFVPILFGISILCLYRIMLGQVSFNIIGMILTILSLIIFVMGCSLILSLIIIGFRDIENILQYAFMALLFITPIGFFVELLSPVLKAAVYLNPIFYFIHPIQKVLAFNAPLTIVDVLVPMSMALIVFYLSEKFFKAFKLTVFELL